MRIDLLSTYFVNAKLTTYAAVIRWMAFTEGPKFPQNSGY